MKTRSLKPITTSKDEIRKLEKELMLFFQRKIYLPIIASMEEAKKIYFNDNNIISEAVRSGNIQYADGIFKGQFNSKTTKAFRALGMKFDKRIKGYRKESQHLPISIQIAIQQTESAYEKTANSIINSTNKLLIDMDEMIEGLDLTNNFTGVIKGVDKSYKESIKIIGITPDLSEVNKIDIARNFSNNTKLFIKDFAEEHVSQLRQQVQEAVFSGIRAQELQQTIIKSFGVSQSKAKFLAKQEISLLTSKYKQSKYQAAGINKYRWSISGVRTRPDHKALNGKTFFYDSPPISNKQTGERNNPSEDFGCNCVDIPIV